MRLLLLVLLPLAVFAAENEAVSDAIAALQRGDLASAEQTLRAHLRTNADDTAALDVLGIVLDQEKKYADADAVYKRATALDPRSPGLLNNYGNHLMATGHLKEARPVFLKVLALNPAHTNATVQLARIALEDKAPAEALRRLETLPPGAKQSPDVAILTLQAEYAAGRNADADALLGRLAGSPQIDARQLGSALASAGRYEKAEQQFSRALESAPGNFEILYSLGLAASHAGDNQRAQEVLQSALRQQPDNVDVLYDLAAVDAELKHSDEALELLAHAERLAPDRGDVLRLLAHTASQVGYFGDAVQAWDRYLKLVPGDDRARRERAFEETGIGTNMKAGLAELRSYVAKHPRDAVGYYELGVAESADNATDALRCFNRAVELEPDLAAAHIARGLMYGKQGNPAAALPDFQAAEKADPANPVVLDRLGQTYMELDRPSDALPRLRKAAELDPRDSRILLHLARALSATGHATDAAAAFQRFRELGPDRSTVAHPAGLVEFLSLSPDEQQARYRAGVERTVRADPRNAEAQVRWLQLLLAERRFNDAATTAQQIGKLQPGAALLHEAASALLESEQYRAARDLLQAAGRSSPELTVDTAIATAHLSGPQPGLDVLDRVPEAERSGDYYLARAEMLATAGRSAESSEALDLALRANPKRPDLYRHSALLLLHTHRPEDALKLAERGATTLPNSPQILLLKAVALELCSGTNDAARTLKSIEDRWPERPDGWVADALVLELHQKYEQARSRLDTATAIGAQSVAWYYAQADAALHANQSEQARTALTRAASLAPDDPAVRALTAQLDGKQDRSPDPADVLATLFY